METKTNDNQISDKKLRGVLITSVICMLVCAICLCASSWAWFVDKQSSEKSIIRSGSFDVKVTLTKDGESPWDLDENGLTLAEGVYTAKLTSVATAGGYVVVSVGSNDYYTDHMPKDGTFEFKFELTEEKFVGFLPMLGYAPDGISLLKTGEEEINEL